MVFRQKLLENHEENLEIILKRGLQKEFVRGKNKMILQITSSGCLAKFVTMLKV
jgi:hypothetical protein